VLNGIFCSFKAGALTLVATDGRRLAMVENELEIPESQEVDVIVPTKAVNELQRLLGDTGQVKISVGESQVASSRATTRTSARSSQARPGSG
jgi:DNA polymerase-3 subunit beta